MKTRVAVVDDHEMVRQGLCALLRREDDLEIVAELADGEAALNYFLGTPPDVAVLDVQLPRMTGIEVLRQLREHKKRLPVIVLSMHREPSFIEAALEAGATGYVLKDGAMRELVDAVRAARIGEVYLSHRIARTAIDVLRSPTRAPSTLSPRERDVLRLLAQGLSTKEIATRLDVSARTIDGHRASLMAKLGIRNVPGLVKYAIKNHLAGLDE